MKDMKHEPKMDKKHEGDHGQPMPKKMHMSEADEMAAMHEMREAEMEQRDMRRMMARKSGPKVI